MIDLSVFKTDETIQEEGDRLGGGYSLPISGVYDATVEMAYIDVSKGGATGIVCKFKLDNGNTLDHTFWATSGTAKGRLNYYVDQQGVKKFLPGFNAANALSLFTTGKKLDQQKPIEGTVMVYNYDLKKDAPTDKAILADIIGKKVKLGVLKQRVNINKKNPATNQYEPTAETKEEVEISKLFHSPSGVTVAEGKAGKTEGEFIVKWEEKNKGIVVDKVNKDIKPTQPAVGGTSTTGTGLLFNTAAA